MKVISKTLGTGTVISHEDGNVTVDFNGEIKTLIVRFANLTDEDGIPFGEQFVPKPKKVKKLNKANFMSVEEFKNSAAGRMNDSEWEAYRNSKVRDSLPSSLR